VTAAVVWGTKIRQTPLVTPDSDIAKATSRVMSIIWDLDFVDIFRVLFMNSPPFAGIFL
jgi:hypothetical protein